MVAMPSLRTLGTSTSLRTCGGTAGSTGSVNRTGTTCALSIARLVPRGKYSHVALFEDIRNHSLGPSRAISKVSRVLGGKVSRISMVGQCRVQLVNGLAWLVRRAFDHPAILLGDVMAHVCPELVSTTANAHSDFAYDSVCADTSKEVDG